MKWEPSLGTDACVGYNSAEMPYEEFTCVYPSLRKLYFDFEIGFDPVHIRDWMVDHPYVPIVAIILYAVGIVAGKAYFGDEKNGRKAWNVRGLLAVWNLFLSVFSFCGVLRVAPQLVHNFVNYTWRENFCMDPESHYGCGSTGLWVLMFILSKFPELFDTFFIIVHKKKLIFLHWYHHISVLLYCWHAYVNKSPVGIIFCVMNYAVHSFMYFYYFLMAIHKKPKFIRAVYITVSQISQMVVGVAVTVVGCYLLWFDPTTAQDTCHLKPENNTAALIMYGSYLFLFLEFFLGRYFTKASSKTKATPAVSNGEIKSNGFAKKTLKSRKED